MDLSIAGLRALIKKEPDAIQKLVSLENVDVLCLQEHKLQEKHVEDIEAQVLIDGWAACWSCSVKPGYSGTCILYRKDAFDCADLSLTRGIGLEKHDQEGRIVTMSIPAFHICNAYVPNSGTMVWRMCSSMVNDPSCPEPAEAGMHCRGRLEASRVPNERVGHRFFELLRWSQEG